MKKIRTWLTKSFEFSVGIAVAIVFTHMLFSLKMVYDAPKKGMASSDAAAWMQAIGAFLALGVAIGVSQLQTAAQKRFATQQQLDEIAGMLQMLATELEVARKNVILTAGNTITNTGAGEAVLMYYPIREKPLTIYEAFIPKLGMITDKALRTEIVETYAYANSFVATIRYNNELFNQWESAQRIAAIACDEAHQIQVDRALAGLAQYGDGVRALYNEAITRTAKLITAIHSASSST